MTSAPKVGIVGYGYAGKTFHAPLIAGVPGLQWVAVSSSDAARVHADWLGLDVHDTPEALIARPDIDLIVIVIATPNATHFAIAQAALQAGEHVVVDKPFTLTLLEAQRLDALATAKERVLSVFHNRRWDGDLITVQRLIASGELGRVTHFESHFDRFRPLVHARWRESAAPVAGLWFDLGPHPLDQALQLFGWPQALCLDAASLSDDWCMVTLHCDRLRVTLHASMLRAACDLRYAVHGTRGSYVKLGLDQQEDALKAGRRPA